MFVCEEDEEGESLYGLMVQDLTLIKPNYDAVGKQGSALRFTQDGYTQGKGLSFVHNKSNNFLLILLFSFQLILCHYLILTSNLYCCVHCFVLIILPRTLTICQSLLQFYLYFNISIQ